MNGLTRLEGRCEEGGGVGSHGPSIGQGMGRGERADLRVGV